MIVLVSTLLTLPITGTGVFISTIRMEKEYLEHDPNK